MALISDRFANRLERFLFRHAVVSEITAINQYRFVRLSGQSLRGINWVPGQSVLIHLNTVKARAYTPITWDAEKGSALFLVFLHGNGPGSEWAVSTKVGDDCLFSTPRKCFDFHAVTGPSLFFGDETSIGSALALHLQNPARQDHYVFEVSSSADTAEIFAHIALPHTQVVKKRCDKTHLKDATELMLHTSSRFRLNHGLFSGNAGSIQTLKKQITFAKPQVRAYWAEGKVALT